MKDNSSTAQERALNLFADMMIEKIKSIQDNWQKPWFTTGVSAWPHNLSGRNYNGMNSFMLLLLCEEKGYKYPIFCTFDRVNGLNSSIDKQGHKMPIVDKDGNMLPKVSVNKGEKSFPVFITVFTVVDKDGNKIPYEEYKKMSQTDRGNYKVFPKLQVYHVFNIDQTNMKEARPELYKKKTGEYEDKTPVKVDDKFEFEPADQMIAENLWICPIKPTYGDGCYYSISKNEIVTPMKDQFKDGESFYGNLFHEMAHSTGAKEVLDRLKPGAFGSAEYAKEELVAEMTAAMVCQYYGMEKHIKDDSAAYLKSWLKSLKEDASFIKTILLDVKRAAGMLTMKMDEIKNTAVPEVA